MSVTYEYYSPQRFGDPTTLTTTPVNLYTFTQKSIMKQLIIIQGKIINLIQL